MEKRKLKRKKQLNVIGCHLDPDLNKSRHAVEVFLRAFYLLNHFVTGKYTEGEDKIILEKVQTNGDDISVFKGLCLELNRNPQWWKNIRLRYKYLLQHKDLNFGKWTPDEEKVVIEKLFRKKELGIDTINSINYSEYKNLTEIRRNVNQVRDHFERQIQPILLSYHYGKLDHNWKYELLSYVVGKKIKAIKEIQWEVVSKLFPYQTRKSLHDFLSYTFVNNRRDRLDYVYVVVQEKLNDYKNKRPTEKEIEYQSEIVKMYLNCKK